VRRPDSLLIYAPSHKPDYRLPVPTLLVHGQLDQIGDIAASTREWARREPLAEHAVIPAAGHASNLDNPAAFTAALIVSSTGYWHRPPSPSRRPLRSAPRNRTNGTGPNGIAADANFHAVAAGSRARVGPAGPRRGTRRKYASGSAVVAVTTTLPATHTNHPPSTSMRPRLRAGWQCR
jgi:hypothetical protein